MTWEAPGFLELALLGLAAFRVWRILGEDTILDRPREWFIRKVPWGEEWVTCPWCAGAWVSAAVWLAWVASPHWATIVAFPFALSAIVGLIAANIDPVDNEGDH